MKFISILFLVILSMSCTREVTINGRVFNKQTSDGEEGFRIAIIENLKKDGSGGTESTTTTDSDGNYSFQIKQKSNKPFKIKFLTSQSDEKRYYFGSHERIIGSRDKNLTLDLPFLRKKRSVVSTENSNFNNIAFTHTLTTEYFKDNLGLAINCQPYDYYSNFYYETSCFGSNSTCYLLEGWNYVKGLTGSNYYSQDNFNDSIFVDINNPEDVFWEIKN
ncbi:MAG: hypothetical protein ACI9XP_000900 [Lentimonas sp.]|jgi:hypothetical protein